jgi:glucosamine--fructose-6-phosphate aminotransferase (isomerizing)
MLGNQMEKEIREQPALLRRNAESYHRAGLQSLRGKSFDMALLVARGSSDNAALYARYLIEVYLQIPVVLAAPSVVTRYHKQIRYPKCLAIGISQSGAAPDVAEVLRSLRSDGNFTLAITNTPGAKISDSADATILLNTGVERSVAATKTYTASLLALYEVVRVLSPELPSPVGLLPDEAWLESSLDAAALAQGRILRSNPVFSLSRGFDFCTAQEAALKLMECALLSCKAFSTADFEHGPKALAGPGSCAISFDGDKPHLTEQGCAIIRAPQVPEKASTQDSVLAPIWNIFFGQWLALLAARARGLNPDDPQFIQKVTQTV